MTDGAETRKVIYAILSDKWGYHEGHQVLTDMADDIYRALKAAGLLVDSA